MKAKGPWIGAEKTLWGSSLAKSFCNESPESVGKGPPSVSFATGVGSVPCVSEDALQQQPKLDGETEQIFTSNVFRLE